MRPYNEPTAARRPAGKKKVIAGLSGGVDSSVAAYLLKRDGYDVIGVTMQIWNQDDKGGCCGISAVTDARRVAQKLDIPYYVLNFKNIFNTKVVDYFIGEYLKGKTPNPCIACNKYVKWESLLEKAVGLGADYIATGHYAQIIEKNGRYTIRRAAEKDQSYVLYPLTQYQLSKTLTPVGGYPKTQIREIAAEIGLEVAGKKDSQEICFIPDNNYGGFISSGKDFSREEFLGNFIDSDGNVLGSHEGIYNYTIGQRKGLKIALGRPVYVKKINPETNEVVLASDADLFVSEITVANINYMALPALETKLEAYGKIRYNHKPALCEIYPAAGGLVCKFSEPQRAPAPGQAAVFYNEENEILLGGEII